MLLALNYIESLNCRRCVNSCDANGNMTSIQSTGDVIGTQTYTYNYRNQLAEYTDSSNNTTTDDMVYIIYRSLKTKTSDGQLFADCLSEKGVISAKEAEEFDIYSEFENIDELLEELLY